MKNKNKKGQGRKPDPSKNVVIRFKLADLAKLLDKHGHGKGELVAALRLLALEDLNNSLSKSCV